MPEYAALDRLQRALNPLPSAAVDGQHQLTITGTVNTVGGGTGGTSSTDESTFTTGGTSLTPMGALNLGVGAQATASMNTGQIGAPRMSPQRILFTSIATPSGGDVMDNTNTAVRVNVVAGGAGGGVANVTVRGSANTDLHVGYASGAGINVDGGAYMPVLGSVNIGGMVGSVNITGSINPVGVFGSVQIVGSVNITGGVQASLAAITVRGTANTDLHVGYASGAGFLTDGGALVPVALFDANSGNKIAVSQPNADAINAANVALDILNFNYGYNGASWDRLKATAGALNIVGSVNPVGVFGSVSVIGSVNITGSINPVGIFGSVSVVGSVQITPQGVQVVDTAASLVPTTWALAVGASGYSGLIPAPGANKVKIYHMTLITTATTDFNIQSPSGTYLTGSVARLLPGAGFVAPGMIRNPHMIGGTTGTFHIYLTASSQVTGWAAGYIEP